MAKYMRLTRRNASDTDTPHVYINIELIACIFETADHKGEQKFTRCVLAASNGASVYTIDVRERPLDVISRFVIVPP